ncbi:Uncharacterized protein dnm_064490 [Desulfonema magnum]|uniref:Uncharacterized protein n=1 Tax=Desulfonema magnum TaxID=45655 RepID=A0A975GRW3_9BACT|nr:Uncharacterized protein dnm_064490 [Desulfonema magnum]
MKRFQNATGLMMPLKISLMSWVSTYIKIFRYFFRSAEMKFQHSGKKWQQISPKHFFNFKIS